MSVPDKGAVGDDGDDGEDAVGDGSDGAIGDEVEDEGIGVWPDSGPDPNRMAKIRIFCKKPYILEINQKNRKKILAVLSGH